MPFLLVSALSMFGGTLLFSHFKAPDVVVANKDTTASAASDTLIKVALLGLAATTVYLVAKKHKMV